MCMRFSPVFHLPHPEGISIVFIFFFQTLLQFQGNPFCVA